MYVYQAGWFVDDSSSVVDQSMGTGQSSKAATTTSRAGKVESLSSTFVHRSIDCFIDFIAMGDNKLLVFFGFYPTRPYRKAKNMSWSKWLNAGHAGRTCFLPEEVGELNSGRGRASWDAGRTVSASNCARSDLRPKRICWICSWITHQLRKFPCLDFHPLTLCYFKIAMENHDFDGRQIWAKINHGFT